VNSTGICSSSQYIARLAAEATTVINAPDYAKVVCDLANRRRLIAAAEDCANAAKTAAVDVPAEQIAQAAAKRINEIITGGPQAEPMTINHRPVFDPWPPLSS
jgi:replicative DNA helicase